MDLFIFRVQFHCVRQNVWSHSLQVRKYIDSTAQASTCDTRSWKDQQLINTCAVLKRHLQRLMSCNCLRIIVDNGHSARTHMRFLQRRRQSQRLSSMSCRFFLLPKIGPCFFGMSILLRIPWPWNVSTICVSTAESAVWIWSESAICVAQFWCVFFFGKSGKSEARFASPKESCVTELTTEEPVLTCPLCNAPWTMKKNDVRTFRLDLCRPEESCYIPEGGLKVVRCPVVRFQLKCWITSS